MELENLDKLIIFSHHEYETFKCKGRKFMVIHKILSNVLAKRTLDGEVGEYTFFNSTKRKDQGELFQAIYDRCPYEKKIIKLKRKIRINFNVLALGVVSLKFIRRIRRTLSETYPARKISLPEIVYIYVDYLAQRDFQKSLIKFDCSGMKCFVVLADVLLFEKTAIDYFNSLNIKTVTAQHGLYFWQDGFENVQKLNYYSVPSRYILTWGSHTNTLFNRLNAGKTLIVCGNPLIKRYSGEHENYIAVCGDTIKYVACNKKMIEIAEQYARKKGIRVLVRLHPADDENNYEIDPSITQYNRDIDKASFIIGHTTTMLCRYMAEGKKVFRYKSDVFFDLVPPSIEFSSEEELEKLADNIEQIDFEQIAKQNIAYLGEESAEQYKNAFEYIYEN